ncbi:MAG TPA: hypothetical protein VFC19_11455 [Candidatus Limnocylindrales bacterium]|nr:hypothetical protein [Candidatus Limnocylindrales bacterium]
MLGDAESGFSLKSLLVVVCLVGIVCGGTAIGRGAKLVCEVGQLSDMCTRDPAPLAETATFINVSWKRMPPYLSYHLEIRFDGLKGQSCLIQWQTVYKDTRERATTHGSLRTGVLDYDHSDWSIDDVRVHEPSPTRSWGTIFAVYCPDDVLLATRHPNYE